jgi:hypothetical protein
MVSIPSGSPGWMPLLINKTALFFVILNFIGVEWDQSQSLSTITIEKPISWIFL